jgi:hypothetical protein
VFSKYTLVRSNRYPGGIVTGLETFHFETFLIVVVSWERGFLVRGLANFMGGGGDKEMGLGEANGLIKTLLYSGTSSLISCCFPRLLLFFLLLMVAVRMLYERIEGILV